MQQRLFYISIFLLLVAPFLSAQEYQPLTELDEFKSSLEQFGKETNSLTCQFVQEKKLKLFKKTVQSSGYFFFLKPGKVHLDYRRPMAYSMIIDGDKLHTVTGAKATTILLNRNKMMAQMGQLIEASMVGNVALLEKDFNLQYFYSTDAYRVVVVPKSSELKKYMSRIEITFDKKKMVVTDLLMEEASGDTTVYSFTKHKINTLKDDKNFRLP